MPAFDDFTLLDDVRDKAVPIILLDRARAKEFLKALGASGQGILKANGFTGAPGDAARLYLGAPTAALRELGIPKFFQGDAVAWVFDEKEADSVFFASKVADLRSGTYYVLEEALGAPKEPQALLDALVLGWGLQTYRYKKSDRVLMPKLAMPSEAGREALMLTSAAWLGRQLINEPANLLGSEELAKRAEEVFASLKSNKDGVKVKSEIIEGERLEKGFPCLAGVGNGSARKPRVFIGSVRKGDDYPTLSLVGKGVVFDTGGCDLKPASGMRLMKKDMGGAALALSLAYALARSDAKLNMELRLGCVENGVSGHAMRPGDILNTRKGLTVEVGSTDAEGRLVLCDLLAHACEAGPDLLLDVATLTGAARVALGPDLPAVFSNRPRLARALQDFSHEARDPFWALPLWDGYKGWLESDVADISNLSSRPLGGAVTAALFLARFVDPATKWLHVDTYGWNDENRPGRPKGGEVLGLSSLYRWFKDGGALASA